MNPTEKKAAELLFAEWLLPLRNANARRRIHYLDGEARRGSYWSAIASRTGGMERLPACDAAALLSMLEQYWTEGKESDLLKLLPALQGLQRELTGGAQEAEQAEEQLTEFVYPLF